MKTRFVRIALIVITTGMAWACNDPAGPGMIEPDMYVRQIVDARVMRDAIQLDMTQTIMECDPEETRPCGSDEGLCQLGTEACTENGLWSGECLGNVDPGEELCDEQDNDCDGLVDEVYRLGQTCKYTDDRGFERTGRVYCNIEDGVPYCRPETDCNVDEDGDGSGVCDDCDDADPQNFPGNEERCDAADNDCDGRTDETFDLDMACQVGEGLCRRGGMTVCAMNGTEVVCDGEPGAPEDETCDGQDNDCDGNTDEGFQLAAECMIGVGACIRPGVIACNAMGEASCMGEPGMPANETCNEADDDCDLNVDEGLGLGEACTVGRGLCERQGINRCNPNGDGTVSCSVEAGEPIGDELCDALDNDCDGVVDEGNPGGGGVCDTQRPGRCGEGIETCIEGAIICQPNAAGIPEVCNEVDDDCNEIVDDVPGRGDACSAGVGECARDGTRECSIGVGLICTAEAGAPSAELCNGLDDDCDGSIDEGNPGGAQACETGQPGRCLLGNTVCIEGELECQRVNDPIAEVCNNVDDDCNELVDDVVGRGDACSAGVGACRNDGTRQCSGNQLVCSARAGAAVPERCDAIDNDCDGLSDEDFALQQPCTVGQGACEAPGITVCAPDALGTICQGEEGLVAVEICNGIDDDCDGRSDENNPESGGQCNTGQAGNCSAGLRNCRMGRLVCDRIEEPEVEVCNGIDDDCDGDIDEGYDVGDACVRGVGICRAAGNMICNAAGDGTECNADPGIPQFELCNGDDDDCDGSTDEEFNLGALCEAGFGRCQTRGEVVCRMDGSAGCNAVPLEPLPDELCNLIDDDCDREIDEGNPEGGAACPVNNPGVCSVGIMNCSEGELSCVPAAVPGELDEVCDGQDNDCNGIIDEGNPGGGVVCQTQDLGACRDGHTQCAGGFLLCFADLAPAPETCDSADNDCDGSIDEAFPTLGDACDSEADEDLCASGTFACDPQTGGLWCSGDENVEEICDNRDNDCDGIIDNGFDKLSDVTNCGTCGRDCRDPDPQVVGQEYPNAACVGGACFQTFYVDETNGSNTTGDGSQENPWRTLRFANRPFDEGGIDASDFAARIYVLPGRYAADQWVDGIQCDGDGNGSIDDLCIEHTVACETDNDPVTIERCTECVCDPSLVCAGGGAACDENSPCPDGQLCGDNNACGGTCSLPNSEYEDFPIKMRDKIQVVGLGNRNHIVVDGGSRTCFIQERQNPDCNVSDRNDVPPGQPGNADVGATLFEAVDMADREFQDDANTCFDQANPRCLRANNPDYAFLSSQPNWSGRGSRNLLANVTLLRGGKGNFSALTLGSNDRYVQTEGKTSLRIHQVSFLKIEAQPGYPVARIDDAEVLFDQILVSDSVGVGASGLILATDSTVTVDRSHFEDNNINQDGYGLLRASNAELNVRNSTFVDNDGGGVFFHSGGRGSVFYSTFADNVNYQVVIGSGSDGPAIIANNLFAFNTKSRNQPRGASVFVHRDHERSSSVHNNFFYEPAQTFFYAAGRSSIGNEVLLNSRSWASDNIAQQDPLISGVAANDLSISSVDSPVVDVASPLPVPIPSASVTPEPGTGLTTCEDDIDCIGRNARDPKWNLPAYSCEDDECVVDTMSDTDGDGFPDWIEIIFSSDELNIASWPPEYDVPRDFTSYLRPSGNGKDIGAYEFGQAE